MANLEPEIWVMVQEQNTEILVYNPWMNNIQI